jgi:hypothetical protein
MVIATIGLRIMRGLVAPAGGLGGSASLTSALVFNARTGDRQLVWNSR